MADDLPTPCSPVHHLARSQSSRPTFPIIVGLHVSILFSVVPSSFSLVPLFLFPGISVLKHFPQCMFFISPHHMPLPVRHSLSDLIEAHQPAQHALSLISDPAAPNGQ